VYFGKPDSITELRITHRIIIMLAIITLCLRIVLYFEIDSRSLFQEITQSGMSRLLNIGSRAIKAYNLQSEDCGKFSSVN
jgi:hypothetical protein